MKIKFTTLLFILTFGFGGSANAAPGDIAFGLKAGTTGLGAEVTFEAIENVNIRIGGNYFKVSTDVEVEGNDYDVDLKLNSYTALADWYITDSSFRITAGAYINENNLNGVAQPSNTYAIDNNVYTAAEVGVLNADINFKSVAPYIGIGWGNPFDDDTDWSFNFDLGVVFAGKPELDITTSGGTLSNNPILLSDIAQAEQDFRDTDEIKYLKFYPVISFGVNYRF